MLAREASHKGGLAVLLRILPRHLVHARHDAPRGFRAGRHRRLDRGSAASSLRLSIGDSGIATNIRDPLLGVCGRRSG